MNAIGIDNVGNARFCRCFRALSSGELEGLVDRWARRCQWADPFPPCEQLASVVSSWQPTRERVFETDDPVERWRLAHDLHVELLERLGYEPTLEAAPVGGRTSNRVIPTIGRFTRGGRPWLWIVEAPPLLDEGTDCFEHDILLEQLAATPSHRELSRHSTDPAPDELLPWDEARDRPTSWKTVFERWLPPMELPPRWVLLLAGDDVVLFEPDAWHRESHLHVDLQTIVDRDDPSTLRIVAALLHREALDPDRGLPLLDRLAIESRDRDRSSAARLEERTREAVEHVGRELLQSLRSCEEHSRPETDRSEDVADWLVEDGLTLVYRLFALLRAKARGMGDELASLRVVAEPETSEGSTSSEIQGQLREHFDWAREHLEGLEKDIGARGAGEADDAATDFFGVLSLPDRLFEPEAFHLLDDVSLDDSVLREVVRLVSTRESGEPLSYDALGSHGLGLVADRLLDYAGFVADEPLCEVRVPEEASPSETRSGFVPESEIERYDAAIVRDPEGQPVVHEEGCFLFRETTRRDEGEPPVETSTDREEGSGRPESDDVERPGVPVEPENTSEITGGESLGGETVARIAPMADREESPASSSTDGVDAETGVADRESADLSETADDWGGGEALGDSASSSTMLEGEASPTLSGAEADDVSDVEDSDGMLAGGPSPTLHGPTTSGRVDSGADWSEPEVSDPVDTAGDAPPRGFESRSIPSDTDVPSKISLSVSTSSGSMEGSADASAVLEPAANGAAAAPGEADAPDEPRDASSGEKEAAESSAPSHPEPDLDAPETDMPADDEAAPSMQAVEASSDTSSDGGDVHSRPESDDDTEAPKAACLRGTGSSVVEIDDAEGASRPDVVAPRASRFGALRNVLDQVAAGRRQPATIADRLGGDVGSIRAYLELAGWLGLVETEPRASGATPTVREPVRATRLGRRFVGDPDASREIARRQMESTPLMRAVRRRDEWPERAGVAVAAVLLERTDMGVDTIRSRAERAARLLDQLGLPRGASSEHDVEIPEARTLPVDLIGPPGMLRSTLDDHAIETIDDLMALDVESLESLDGVGPEKARSLRNLRERVDDVLEIGDDPSPDPLAAAVVDAWIEAGWDGRERLDDVELEMPTGLARTFEETGIERLEQVAGVIAHMELAELPGVDASTVSSWREQLELLASEGWETHRFGPRGRPETISALIDRCRGEIEPRTWRILRCRLADGATWKSIGDREDLSDTRVRQIATRTIETWSERYGDLARDLTRPIRRLLDGETPGLVYRKRMRRLIGTDDPLLVAVVLRIAGVDEAVVWEGDFVRTADVSEIESTLESIEARCGETHRLFLERDDVLRFADQVGLDMEVDALEALLRIGSEAAFDRRGRLHNPRATLVDRAAEALRGVQQTLRVDAWLERFDRTHAADGDSLDVESLRTLARRHPLVYEAEGGEYVHRDTLPLDESTLLAVERRCLNELRGKEHGVSPRWMLEQLEATELGTGGRLAPLDSGLLGRMLLRHDNVGTSIEGHNVTWTPTHAYDDVPLAARLERMLEAAGATMSVRELVECFPEALRIPTEMVSLSLSEIDGAIRLGDGWIHARVLGLNDDQRARVDDAIEATLTDPADVLLGPDNGDEPAVESYASVAETLRNDETLAPVAETAETDEREWRDVVAALVDAEPSFVVGPDPLVARRDTVEAQQIDLDDDADLLDRAIAETVAATYPSYPREIAARMRGELDVESLDVDLEARLETLQRTGPLGRVTPGLYFPEDVPDDMLFERLEHIDRDLAEVTERSDLEALPSSELWVLARFLHETSRLLKAKQVLDVLADRDDPDEAWLECLEEVRSTIQEML